MENKIANIFSDLIHCLEGNRHAFTNVKSIIINESFYNEDYLENDIRRSSHHLELFTDISSIKEPVLYWFSFNSGNIDSKIIREKYERTRNKTNRNCASYRTYFDAESTTLYVGKVKTDFWGRLITHLGYTKNIQTAGLQLYHWYEQDFPELQLNYVIFGSEMADLISLFELQIARELKPLIGKY
jgi:hypothetical protein